MREQETQNIRPEVYAVLRDLGVAAGRLATPEVISATDKVLAKLGDHGKTLSWFKKLNPMLGASPLEIIRLGRAAQLANYINSTIS